MQLGAAPALLGLLPISDAALALALRVCATAEVDHRGCIDDGAAHRHPSLAVVSHTLITAEFSYSGIID